MLLCLLPSLSPLFLSLTSSSTYFSLHPLLLHTSSLTLTSIPHLYLLFYLFFPLSHLCSSTLPLLLPNLPSITLLHAPLLLPPTPTNQSTLSHKATRFPRSLLLIIPPVSSIEWLGAVGERKRREGRDKEEGRNVGRGRWVEIEDKGEKDPRGA